MNKNKVIALIIALGVYFGPFYYLFIRNNGNDPVDSAFEMFMFLGWLLGWILAFGIAVSEPFGKKHTTAAANTHAAQQRRAA